MRLSILTAAALALVLASCGNKNCSCNCKCDGCTCAASADTTANADANNYTVVEKPQVDISKLPVDKHLCKKITRPTECRHTHHGVF